MDVCVSSVRSAGIDFKGWVSAFSVLKKMSVCVRCVPTNFPLERTSKDGCLCVVERRGSSVGAIPTRQWSLQPVAIGAAVEVTKPSKPST